ncbi:MAG: T9SS type A sorting domain-containing protein [Bacteroidetes bacterium]|nr:T9SS type A sorting domain-containing protein [Bacteroidota bacterium]
MKRLLTLALMVLSLSAFSQFTFEKHYGASPLSESGTDIMAAPAGGFFVLGSCAVDPYRNSDLWLLKTDGNNDTLWSRRIGTAGNEFGNQIILSSSSNELLLAGMFEPTDSIKADFLCVKTDLEGNVLWSNTYGTANNDYEVHIIAASGGGYLLAGFTADPVNGAYSNLYLLKINENGGQIWEQEIMLPQYFNGYQLGLSKFSDGTYLVTASNGDPGLPDIMLHLTQTGLVFWQYDSYNNLKINSVIHKTAGGFLLSGYYQNMDTYYHHPAVVVLDEAALNPAMYVFPDSTQNPVDCRDIQVNASGKISSLMEFYDDNYTIHNYLWVIDPISSQQVFHELANNSEIRHFMSFAEHPDNEYHITGNTSEVYGGSDLLMVKTDGTISYQSNKFYGLAGEPGQEFAYTVCQTSDGGYLLGGYRQTWVGGPVLSSETYLLKTDVLGNEMWGLPLPVSQGYSIFDVIQAIDGGYLVFSTGPHVRVDKVSVSGTVLWTSELGEQIYLLFGSILQKPDGSIYIGATIQDPASGIYSATIIKLSSAGDSLWTKYHHISTYFTRCYDLIASSDGGFILAGQVTVPGKSSDVLLVKTNANGDLQWIKNYGNADGERATSVIENTDGTIVAFGRVFPNLYYNAVSLILKVNAAGDSLTSVTLGNPNDYDFAGYAITHAYGGGYAILSLFTPANSSLMERCGSLIRLDDQFNILWERKFGKNLGLIAYEMETTPDHGFVIGGIGNYPFTENDIYLLKTDQNGQVVAGVPEADQTSELILYPNPAHDRISLRFNKTSGQEQVEIGVFDMQGREYIRNRYIPGNQTNIMVNISPLAPGVYFIQVDGPQRMVKKFVKY